MFESSKAAIRNKQIKMTNNDGISCNQQGAQREASTGKTFPRMHAALAIRINTQSRLHNR